MRGGATPSILPNGNLVFTSITELKCVNQQGHLAWKISLPDGYPGFGLDPAVDGYGTTYFFDRNGLHAVSEDGVMLWTARPLGSQPSGIPLHPVVGADRTTYVGLSLAMSAYYPDGTRRWLLDSPRNFWSDCTLPSLNQSGELVAGLSKAVRSSYVRLSPDSMVLASNHVQSVLWYRGQEAAISRDGTAYFVTRDSLICFNTNGILQWTNSYRPEPFDSYARVPALDQAGNIYVTGLDLEVFDRNGARIRQIELARSPTGPPVLTEDGKLYLTDGDRLRAFAALAELDTAAPWPMYRHDPAGTASHHRNVVPPENPNPGRSEPFANKVRITCDPSTVPRRHSSYSGGPPLTCLMSYG